MPSTLTWLDHDPAERERMQRVLALFREKEARDELGLGGIRDAFADRLFPGTSTIQTRLRYMLFIPWLYQGLEERKVRWPEVERAARRLETGLIQPLLDHSDGDGVLGRLARAGLKRLPSSVYWAGLASWRILRFPGSQSQYHRSLEAVYRLRQALNTRREEGEAERDRRAVTWHPKLPKPPADFPERADFRLTPEEALFLMDCVATAHPNSLLKTLFFRVEGTAEEVADYPWEHPALAEFTDEQRDLLDQARLVAVAMQGASFLYNLMLAEVFPNDELVGVYRDELQKWRDELPHRDLAGWRLPHLWDLVVNRGHAITPAARRFVEEWVGRVVSTRGDVADDAACRTLVRAREVSLKRQRSRFQNRRALDQWSGSAGIGRMAYRWPTASTFLRDLREALK